MKSAEKMLLNGVRQAYVPGWCACQTSGDEKVNGVLHVDFPGHCNSLILQRGAGRQSEKKPQTCCGLLVKQATA